MVRADMALDPLETRLAWLFTASVLGRWDEVERARRNAPAGEPNRAWRETVLMVHLFAGMPRQVETYEAIERAGGLGPRDPEEESGDTDQIERGRDLFGIIYGNNATTVESRLHDFHPDFHRFILGHAYGRVLSRPGLTARQRELFAVGALAALGQERQLASHARGAIHCGATASEVIEALEVVAPLIAHDRLDSLRQVLVRFIQPRST